MATGSSDDGNGKNKSLRVVNVLGLVVPASYFYVGLVLVCGVASLCFLSLDTSTSMSPPMAAAPAAKTPTTETPTAETPVDERRLEESTVDTQNEEPSVRHIRKNKNKLPPCVDVRGEAYCKRIAKAGSCGNAPGSQL